MKNAEQLFPFENGGYSVAITARISLQARYLVERNGQQCLHANVMTRSNNNVITKCHNSCAMVKNQQFG